MSTLLSLLIPTYTLQHTGTRVVVVFFKSHLSMIREVLILFIVKSFLFFSKQYQEIPEKASYYKTFKQSCIHSESHE